MLSSTGGTHHACLPATSQHGCLKSRLPRITPTWRGFCKTILSTPSSCNRGRLFTGEGVFDRLVAEAAVDWLTWRRLGRRRRAIGSPPAESPPAEPPPRLFLMAGFWAGHRPYSTSEDYISSFHVPHMPSLATELVWGKPEPTGPFTSPKQSIDAKVRKFSRSLDAQQPPCVLPATLLLHPQDHPPYLTIHLPSIPRHHPERRVAGTRRHAWRRSVGVGATRLQYACRDRTAEPKGTALPPVSLPRTACC